MSPSQSEELRNLVEHARRHSEYYAAYFPAPNEPLPEDVRALIARLPPLDRAGLREHRQRLLAHGLDPNGLRRAFSSGTTGEPIEMTLDTSARRAEETAIAGHLTRSLGSESWRGAPLCHLTLHAESRSRAAPSPFDAESSVVKWNLLGAWCCSDQILGQALRRLEGCVVTTMPSIVELILARGLPARAFRPRAVVLSGEQVDAELVRRLEAFSVCPVLSLYTMTEAGVIGFSCPAGGYHPDSAVEVEILDGEILVTPLRNFAMPLFRYRTGERGRWLPRACSCPASGRFAIDGGRRASWLSTSSATASVVGLAKLLGGLSLERFDIRQDTTDEVTVSYVAVDPISPQIAAVITTAVKTALGPSCAVRLKRAIRLGSGGVSSGSVGIVVEQAGPSAPDNAAIAAWLAGRLQRLADVEVAVLTGSAVEPGATTRFSDIDLVAFHPDPFGAAATELATALRAEFPKLSVHLETTRGLARRAPLLTCRLHAEQFPVLGSCDASFLEWPARGELAAEARFWAQNAQASLWLRVTASEARPQDPVYEAWFVGKFALTALRYLLVLAGATETASASILAAAHLDPKLKSFAAQTSDLLSVAREHRPPPIASSKLNRQMSTACLALVRHLAAELDRAM